MNTLVSHKLNPVCDHRLVCVLFGRQYDSLRCVPLFFCFCFFVFFLFLFFNFHFSFSKLLFLIFIFFDLKLYIYLMFELFILRNF